MTGGDFLLRLLGLAARAGGLTFGVDGTRAALQHKRARCVVMAKDAGTRAQEKVLRLAEGTKVPVIWGPTADELGARLGRPPIQAIGVTDSAIARGLLKDDNSSG